jgi:hypothetical protein
MRNLRKTYSINTFKFWLKSDKSNEYIKVLAKFRKQYWTHYVKIYIQFCMHTAYFTKYLSKLKMVQQNRRKMAQTSYAFLEIKVN